MKGEGFQALSGVKEEEKGIGNAQWETRDVTGPDTGDLGKGLEGEVVRSSLQKTVGERP